MTEAEMFGELKRVWEAVGQLARKILTCNHLELDRVTATKYRCSTCGRYFVVDVLGGGKK